MIFDVYSFAFGFAGGMIFFIALVLLFPNFRQRLNLQEDAV